jgi:hypothetical protein
MKAIMNFVEALTAIAILIDFLFGVTFGFVGGAILGSRREDYDFSLLQVAPDPLSAGARVIYGVFTRDDGYLQALLPGGAEAARNQDGDDESGSQGQGLDQ